MVVRDCGRATGPGRRANLGAIAAVILVTVVAGTTGALAEQESFDGIVAEEAVVPNRFGEGMKAYLWFPAKGGVKAEGRFPVILRYNYGAAYSLERTPTGERLPLPGLGTGELEPLERFAHEGYVAAIVNWPGTGGSQGMFGFFDERMRLAGYDAVEWLAAQPWSTEKVGMFGGSGNGVSQVFTAETRPPHLVTIIPIVTTTDFYEDVLYRGGMPSSTEASVVSGIGGASIALNPWTIPNDADEAAFVAESAWKKFLSLQFVPPLYPVEWYQHPAKDAYWERWVARLDQIDGPIWSLGSWDDHFLRGNVSLYTKTAGPNMLAISFSGHGIGSGFQKETEGLRWFDYWLKGIDTGIAEELETAPVRYYVQQENVWKTAVDWPIPGTQFTNLYLDAGPTVAPAVGSLSVSAPETGGADTYLYEPAQGRHNGQVGLLRASRPNASNSDATTYNAPTAPGDQRLEAGDSPTYLSEPLETDTEITGPIAMTLQASSTATDTDWVVKLIDVFPDGAPAPTGPQPGYWNLVTTGWLKGTHRNGHVRPEPIPVGEIVRYEIELLPTSYLFRAGHRIGIQVASADAAKTIPNPNPASNTVYRAATYPSSVTLPVVPRGKP